MLSKTDKISPNTTWEIVACTTFHSEWLTSFEDSTNIKQWLTQLINDRQMLSFIDYLNFVKMIGFLLQ